MDSSALVLRLDEASSRIRSSKSADEARALLGEALERFGGSSPELGAARAQLTRIAEMVVERFESSDAATRARESLFAGICHDLRNPLNTFAMSTSLLRGDLERQGPEAKHALSLLDRMDRGQLRMRAIVDDLVEASRIDARKVELSRVDLSAKELLEEAARAATPAAVDKRIALTLQDLDEHARVSVDRARMLDLFARIIAYGTRTTGDGGTLRMSVVASGGDVAFVLRASFPAAVQPSLDRHSGGLPLLIARGVAALHDGRLDIGIEEDGATAKKELAVVVTVPAAART